MTCTESLSSLEQRAQREDENALCGLVKDLAGFPQDEADVSSSAEIPKKAVQDVTEAHLCTSLDCPVRSPHTQGVFQHDYSTKLSRACSRHFLPSVPPPFIAECSIRCSNGEGTLDDQVVVEAFHRLHTRPFIDDGTLRWSAPKRVDASHVCEARNQHWTFDHPFDFTNPPDSVWQAFNRIMKDEGSARDEEFVRAFSADKAYYDWTKGCLEVNAPTEKDLEWKRNLKVQQRATKKRLRETLYVESSP